MGLKKYEKTRDDSAETESPVSEFYYGGEHYQRQDWRRRACDSNPNDRRLGMYEAGDATSKSVFSDIGLWSEVFLSKRRLMTGRAKHFSPKRSFRRP